MNKHQSSHQSMNQKRRYNDTKTKVIATQRNHQNRSDFRFSDYTLMNAKKIFTLLSGQNNIPDDVRGHHDIVEPIIEVVKQKFENLTRAWYMSPPEKSSLLENGRVVHEDVDLQRDSYMRVTVSRSGKSLLLSYRTHQPIYRNNAFECYRFSEPIAFPRNTTWNTIREHIDMLGDKVNIGEQDDDSY